MSRGARFLKALLRLYYAAVLASVFRAPVTSLEALLRLSLSLTHSLSLPLSLSLSLSHTHTHSVGVGVPGSGYWHSVGV
jgi:hypothetical protein